MKAREIRSNVDHFVEKNDEIKVKGRRNNKRTRFQVIIGLSIGSIAQEEKEQVNG